MLVIKHVLSIFVEVKGLSIGNILIFCKIFLFTDFERIAKELNFFNKLFISSFNLLFIGLLKIFILLFSMLSFFYKAFPNKNNLAPSYIHHS
jgi:hypothetical protein